jgi:hypothetical protein
MLRRLEKRDYLASAEESHAGRLPGYLVEHAPGSDPREAIFRLAVARGWVLTALTATQASLEDVFVRLTTHEEPPVAAEV